MADEDVIEEVAAEEGVIPAEKIQEAHAVCMQDPKLAKYFNEAPYGAKQYIALMFYCTVFSEEVDDDLCAKYQQEVEEELTRDDALYLATRDTNPISKSHFRELYLELKRAAEKSEEGSGETVETGAGAVVSLAGVERRLDGLQAELQQTRKLLAEHVTRESGAPGALTLGTLALVLLVTATVVPPASAPIVLALTFVAALSAACSGVHDTRELKPLRICGLIFGLFALVGGLATLIIRFMVSQFI